MGTKTKSLWGAAPARYYNWLDRAVKDYSSPPTLAVLGCSDGKFVLPAARRGMRVTAIDLDPASLYGGEKLGADGKPIHMPGLTWRLAKEGLADLVTVRQADLATVVISPPCDLVFISGAIQYAVNLQHPIHDIVANVQSCVAPGGRIYIEYMVAVEERHKGLDNYPAPRTWATLFSGADWRVTSNRVTQPAEDSRAGIQVRAKHRIASWGHLKAERSA